MESLQMEVAPFGIHTTIVEPGFFRTDLLATSSIQWSEIEIADYAERLAMLRPNWEYMNGKQGGDPAKFATALLKIANEDTPPKRWMAGADCLAEVERKIKALQEPVVSSLPIFPKRTGAVVFVPRIGMNTHL